MGSTNTSQADEVRNSSLASTFSVGATWSAINTALVNSQHYIPKYATNITSTAYAEYYIASNFIGDERARMYDGNSTSDYNQMLFSDTISTGKWVSKSADLVGKGIVRSSMGTNTTVFTNKSNGWICECFSDVRQTSGNLRIRNRKITVSWTDPKIKVNVSAGTGGTVSGGGDAVITYRTTVASVTITASPQSGYEFVSWNDGDTNATRTLSFSESDLTGATTTKSYTATFKATTTGTNKIYVGNNKIQSIYLGNTPVKAVYVGNTKVYEQ